MYIEGLGKTQWKGPDCRIHTCSCGCTYMNTYGVAGKYCPTCEKERAIKMAERDKALSIMTWDETVAYSHMCYADKQVEIRRVLDQHEI